MCFAEGEERAEDEVFRVCGVCGGDCFEACVGVARLFLAGALTCASSSERGAAEVVAILLLRSVCGSAAEPGTVPAEVDMCSRCA